jgi:hypothetical protein
MAKFPQRKSVDFLSRDLHEYMMKLTGARCIRSGTVHVGRILEMFLYYLKEQRVASTVLEREVEALARYVREAATRSELAKNDQTPSADMKKADVYFRELQLSIACTDEIDVLLSQIRRLEAQRAKHYAAAKALELEAQSDER